jgi:endonuclease YncB( thermonuclease family)
MRNAKLLVLFAAFLFPGYVHSQRGMTGSVVEVLGTDTIAVVEETRNTRFVLKLQFVDGPEHTQPLYDVVKNHLTKLALNKLVFFEMNSLSTGLVNSRVTLNGTDLSLQMLRDGAAWYSVPYSNSHRADERAVYLETETQAKNEKRGVWGIAGIRPAYELRAEREKAEQERLDKAWKEYIASAIAMAKFSEPAIGMHYFSFKRLCEARPARGDYTSNRETRYGTTIYKSLVSSEERERTGCWGDLHFDENLRLTSMGKSGFVK